MRTQGFTLVEAVVALGVFVIFVVGIYGSVQLSFSLVYQSRIRIIGTALLNERMEIVRNTSFENVGIKNGSPAGLFERTTTTNRNGMIFEVTHTIRNIDDPYDGVIGGTPSDMAPADYKFVQIDARCLSCGQAEELSMYTYVAPKYLEGNSDNGALFVRVINAYGDPVSGAMVRVVNTTTNPVYDFSDTTDSEGYLRVYDLVTSTATYMVEASKSGYTLDYTRSSTLANPNPVTPLVSVLKQAVSNLTLTIDQVSSLQVVSQNPQCVSVPNVNFSIQGTRVIGTNPDVYLAEGVYSTGQSASLSLPLPWDKYLLGVVEYDLVGTIPDVPLSLLPGSSQNVTLIVGSNTSRSLMVLARHQGSPVAGARVTIAGPNNFLVEKTTGVGSVAQTDWSLGGGNELFGDGRGYSTMSGVDVTSNPGTIILAQNGGNFVQSGYLESSTIEVGESARYIQWSWDPLTQPSSTTVRLQIATATSSNAEWNFVGPDGTGSTFYTENNITISSIHDNDRFMRYRIYMDTENQAATPLVSDISFIYTNECTPPGQTYVGGLSPGTYTVTIDADGFHTYQDQLEITGDQALTADLTSL